MTTVCELKERPILFSGEMVKAILEGRKTQTRRVVKPQPVYEGKRNYGDSWAWNVGKADYFSGVTTEQLVGKHGLCYRERSVYGVPGDRLWVRETIRAFDDGDIFYRADGPKGYIPVHADDDPKDWRWTPAIHMPRSASRINLEVTEVRVERLQEISEADAEAEGVEITDEWTGAAEDLNGSHREAYRFLWDKINGRPKYVKGAGFGGETAKFASAHTWQDNPWVWCIHFKSLAG